MRTIDGIPREAVPSVRCVRLSPTRRILDVVVASTLLVVLAPLLILLAVLVRITSGGPVLFRQQRMGEGGRTFALYKFRTMRNGSTGPGVTGYSDLRVTGTGRMLRQLHLDELPQLWNVLRGDMTLVGPRPEIPDLACRYPPQLQWVFRHRPGLTGPCQLRSRADAAQIEGRCDPEEYYLTVLVPQRVALDAEFLRHATTPNVLRLAGRTVLYVLSAGWEGCGHGEAARRRKGASHGDRGEWT
ncbi:sugar transferase [Streptomyces sp. NPDC006602]|uniref:sugar transferase n=1 Tax=Streptomyces sp. NPDC006602 TaxID=3364751 RepID=UPI00368C1D51